MLPILTNLKNSISCSLKKINTTTSKDDSTNDKNNSKTHVKRASSSSSSTTKSKFDAYTCIGSTDDDDTRKYIRQKLLDNKSKSKSLHRNDLVSHFYYHEYMKQKQQQRNSSDEPNPSAEIHMYQHENLGHNTLYNFNRHSTNEMLVSSSAASLPAHFDASQLVLGNKRTKSTRMKSFSSFFKKLNFFGLSELLLEENLEKFLFRGLNGAPRLFCII